MGHKITKNLIMHSTPARGCVKIQFNHGVHGEFTEITEFK